MKNKDNNFVLAITILVIACFVPRCSRSKCAIEWPIPATHLIQFKKQVTYHLDKNGTELNVMLDFNSVIADDACLILYAEKEYHLLSLDAPVELEGFKDSLKIDGFHVRSYFLPTGCYADEVLNPVDYPVYIKKVSIKKGANREEFKIVFPRNIASIPGKVMVSAGIVRLNDEIRNNFE